MLTKLKNVVAIRNVSKPRKPKIRFMKTGHRGCGVEAYFIQLTKKIGLKIFHDRDKADRSLKRQRRAYNHHIAPAVLSPVFRIELTTYVRKNVTRTLYGYKTEFANVKKCDNCSHEGGSMCDGCPSDDRYWEWTPELETQFSEKMESIGLSGCDLHDFNVGKVNGRWVVIDFDDVSNDHNTNTFYKKLH
jgi:hypothetical protein